MGAFLPLTSTNPGRGPAHGPRAAKAAPAGFADAPRASSRLCPARIAVYDARGAAPRVEEIDSVEIPEYISRLSARTYEIARELGGDIPFTVVSELVENFIHADFQEPVVTIMDGGGTIRFSDQGPGITDKELATRPGYTTATIEMKRFIRGVGSGLPLACECLSYCGASLSIDDNLGVGTVVTVTKKPVGGLGAQGVTGLTSALPPTGSVFEPTACGAPVSVAGGSSKSAELTLLDLAPAVVDVGPRGEHLTHRQKRVLALVMDSGSAGPSLVARELAIGLSTAYRDLARLEELGLIAADESGKRSMTAEGTHYLDQLLHAE